MLSTQTTRVVGTIVARMEPGEDILETLESIVSKNAIGAGHLMLIGAINGATLGYFDLKTKEYRNYTIDEDLEVTSCIGNISSLEDGTPVVHAHMVVSDEKGTTYSGHLMKGCKVSVTIEVMITILEGTLRRAVDDKTGLNLLSFK